MPVVSAGLLMYRVRSGSHQVLLIHPGGPFWAGKDAGAWMLPKGHVEPGEDLLAAARREFREETGFEPPSAPDAYISLGSVRQSGGKIVHAWAFEGDCDPASLRSNTTNTQWPPRSGRWITYPEVDRGEWYPLDRARRMMLPSQVPLLDRLAAALGPRA